MTCHSRYQQVSVLQEEFLEDINCILNSGEVPGLFDNEEMDSIIMELKQLASEHGVPDNRIAVFQFFIDVRFSSAQLRTISSVFTTMWECCKPILENEEESAHRADDVSCWQHIPPALSDESVADQLLYNRLVQRVV